MLVPIAIWAVMEREWVLAFWVFVIAGASDGVDGFIARHFSQRTEIGAYLDPLADKALLVSLTIALALVGAIPNWLALIIVSRDVMIVGAVLVSWIMEKPLEIKPLMISKINTALQITLVALVLASRAFGQFIHWPLQMAVILTALFTIASAFAYSHAWLRHMTENESEKAP